VIDLHIHTNYSDGTSSVSDVLKIAQNKKLEYISITDHDNCNAYKELENPETRELFSGKIINGVELKCCIEDGRRIEILAYGFDMEKLNDWLIQFYKDKTSPQREIKYFDQLYKTCISKKIKVRNRTDLDWKDTSEAYYILYDEIKKYPENKEKVPEDLWNDFNVFTRKYCGLKEYDFFIDKSKDYPSVAEVVDVIKECNGLSFVAHPFQYKNIENVPEFLEETIKKYKVDGLECYYSKFTKEQTQYLLDLCKEKGLYTSGGSDYHGTVKPDVKIGTGIDNSLNIDVNSIAWLN
jgi:predicted metal-dependent phosphoesterase TrpH